MATALDGLLDSVMEGIVHRMVMQTLKCVYHKVLEVSLQHRHDSQGRREGVRTGVKRLQFALGTGLDSLYTSECG